MRLPEDIVNALRRAMEQKAGELNADNRDMTREQMERFAAELSLMATGNSPKARRQPSARKAVSKTTLRYTVPELKEFLTSLWDGASGPDTPPVMLWGPPGLGKSAAVAEVAEELGLELVDIRISQLAPTDLRGVPVPDKRTGVSHFYPPSFLPTDGRGVLFLDELNTATPAMQAIAQQLILDRKVGDYILPVGWFIAAAGNRRSDGASVHTMPTPVANRMAHIEVLLSRDAWVTWALGKISPDLVAFFRAAAANEAKGTCEMLLRPSSEAVAWPSPRSWQMADKLYRRGLSIAPAVGEGAATAFLAWLEDNTWLEDLHAWAFDGGKPPALANKDLAGAAYWIAGHGAELVARAEEEGVLTGESLSLAKSLSLPEESNQ